MSNYIDKSKLAERLLASPIFKNVQNGDLIRDAVIDLVLGYPTVNVAREIFEEIEREIKNHGICYTQRKIAELKNKYTEGEG